MGILAFEAPFMSDESTGAGDTLRKHESMWELVLGTRSVRFWVGSFCANKWMCNRLKGMNQCRPEGFHSYPLLPCDVCEDAIAIWRRA
jgi:hypothetical protein